MGVIGISQAHLIRQILKMLKISIIGCGNIGSFLLKSVKNKILECEVVSVLDKDVERVEKLRRELNMKFNIARNINELIKNSNLVVEAASQDAVREYSAEILESGCSLMIMSVGALVDNEFFNRLRDICIRRNVKIYIPSGAVAGIDGLKAARLSRINSVSMTTRKNPRALNLPDSSKKIVYEGSAGEGIKKFPENVNVAATVSMAGIGIENTKLRIISDPEINDNVHEIHVYWDFGEFKIKMKNLPSKENPKTSFIAALSAIAMLKRISEPVEIGT